MHVGMACWDKLFVLCVSPLPFHVQQTSHFQRMHKVAFGFLVLALCILCIEPYGCIASMGSYVNSK